MKQPRVNRLTPRVASADTNAKQSRPVHAMPLAGANVPGTQEHALTAVLAAGDQVFRGQAEQAAEPTVPLYVLTSQAEQAVPLTPV